MKLLRRTWLKQRGMTLIEVIVIVGLLSAILIGAMTIYSDLFAAIRGRDQLITVLHEANVIMTSIGDDIRHAVALLNDYQGNESQTVMAAFKVKQETSAQPEERVIVYAVDPQRPNRLLRTVQIGDRSTALELSTHVQQLEIAPKSENILAVHLVLQYPVAGKVNTWRTSSVFALRQ
jgi:type II secretory pathway component PulJ